MEKMYAFLDESGAYGFDFSKSGNSTLFIIAAIIVKEADLKNVESKIKNIRQKEFNGHEIKSNKIKGNNIRRVRILNDVLKLPFHIFSLVVDKKSIFSECGLSKSKRVFYKFINQLLYQELRVAYPNLKIVSDSVGDSEYIKDFINYVNKNRKPISLFDFEEFNVVDSRSEDIVQLADLIAGTLSYIYEDNKRKSVPGTIDYLKMLDKRLLIIKFFPHSYDEKLFEHSDEDINYNKEIALLVFRKATDFINTNKGSNDEEIRMEIYILNYLLFRFKYNRLRKYISTKELMLALDRNGYGKISEQSFRNIIGQLRDKEVIMSSSSKGYKLPSSEKEICDYYHHVNGVILPMIHRLNLCNDFLSLSSDSLDYLNKEEFKGLKAISDSLKTIEHHM